MTPPTGESSIQGTNLVFSTLNARSFTPLTPPRVLASFHSASHAVQGIQPESKHLTNRLLEIYVYEARGSIEKADRWIEAARELESKEKYVTEWKVILGELLGRFGAVYEITIELKAILCELHEASIYDELRT